MLPYSWSNNAQPRVIPSQSLWFCYELLVVSNPYVNGLEVINSIMYIVNTKYNNITLKNPKLYI